jgi:hypothetical protein
LPVEITEAGYATFFAPVAVIVPAGVTAYTATVDGEWVILNEIEGGVIPANTGVVLQGAKGIYNFAITTTDATVTSALLGTVAATYITENAYVLGYINVAEEGQPEKKEVGFYKADMNQNAGNATNKVPAFINNSHKAYLPIVSGVATSASLRFSFGGTTAVEDITEKRAESKEIYDLTGRRVNEINKAGVYIVNGRKVLVK